MTCTLCQFPARESVLNIWEVETTNVSEKEKFHALDELGQPGSREAAPSFSVCVVRDINVSVLRGRRTCYLPGLSFPSLSLVKFPPTRRSRNHVLPVCASDLSAALSRVTISCGSARRLDGDAVYKDRGCSKASSLS